MKKAGLVFLVRHGRAEDHHPSGDGARALTGEGRQQFRDHMRELQDQLDVRAIATSHLVRAVQTAEIMADVLGVETVSVRPELAFPRATGAVVAALALELGPGWALVGHNPAFGDALTVMLKRSPSEGPPRFGKGCVVALEIPPTATAAWPLAWLAAPGRKLKKSLEND